MKNLLLLLVMAISCYAQHSRFGQIDTGNISAIEVVDGNRNVTVEQALGRLPAAGGTVFVPTGFRESYTSTITIGNGRVGFTDNVTTLVLAPNVTLTCNVTSNVDCIELGSYAGILGTGPGESSGTGLTQVAASVLNVSATAVYRALVAPRYRDGTQQNMWLRNLYLKGAPSAIQGVAAVDLTALGDETELDDVSINNFPGTDLRISGDGSFICCGILLKDLWINGQGLTTGVGGATATAYPIVISAGNSAHFVSGIHFVGGSFTNSGQGAPLIQINGNGNQNDCRNISFVGSHIEVDQTPAASTITVTDCNNVSFINLDNTTNVSIVPTQLFNISETVGNYTTGIDIRNVYNPSATYALVDSRYNFRTSALVRNIAGSYLNQYSDSVFDNTVALATTTINANTCSDQTFGIGGSGAIASDVAEWSWAITPIGVTGYGVGGLQVSTYVVAANLHVVVCNITGSNITPGAMSINIRLKH